MMTGPRPVLQSPLHDQSVREKFVVAPRIAVLLVLGFYPKPALDLLNPAVAKTLSYVGVTDPAPTTAADGSAK
jgi:NADH-quinone oxidoreductase subunit M